MKKYIKHIVFILFMMAISIYTYYNYNYNMMRTTLKALLKL